MNNNCYDTCELASYEYIDSAILNRINTTSDIDEFLNSFTHEEIIAIACYLAHRGDREFVTYYDVNELDAAIVLSDYIRHWIVDNLKCGHIDGSSELLCMLYDIRDAHNKKCFHHIAA